MTAATTRRARVASITRDVACCAAFGLAAIHLGQGAGWDLQNYHFYDPWAWLTGRLDRDVAPAQLQSFFNPLLYVPFYLAAVSWPAVLVTFVLGALHGINAVLLHRLAHAMLPDAAARWRWLAWAIALAGATGATGLGELGATQGDNLVSIPALAALLVATRAARRHDASPATADRHPGERRDPAPSTSDNARTPTLAALITGALLGIAVGLKLTMLPIAAGLALATLILHASAPARWTIPLVIGGLAGLALAAGPWALVMWHHWGDPLFPWLSTPPFGDAFTTQSLQDARWHPHGAIDVATRAWQWLGDWRITSELRMRDVRVPLALGVVLLLPWWRRGGDASRRRLAFACATAFVVAYLGWSLLSGYYRYLATLELLAPLVIVVVAMAARAPAWPARTTVALLLVLVTITTNPADWGRLKHHGARYIETTWPDLARTPDALLVLSGDEPLSYVLPSFPGGATVVRIDGNIHGGERPVNALDRRAAAAIDAHRGPLLLLVAASPPRHVANAQDAQPDVPNGALQATGLAKTADSRCERVISNVRRHTQPPLWLCPLQRVEPAAAALARREAAIR